MSLLGFLPPPLPLPPRFNVTIGLASWMTETASKNKRRAQFWKGLDSMKPKTAAFPWGLLCPSTPCCWATSGEEQTDLTMGRKFRDRAVGTGDVCATTGDVCATTAFVNIRSMDPEGQGSQKSHCGDLFQIDLVSLPKKKSTTDWVTNLAQTVCTKHLSTPITIRLMIYIDTDIKF